MKVNIAIKNRINELCKKYDLTINGLASRCMITQSTLNNIVNENTNNVKILTIFRICAGLEITIQEFFNSDFFSDIDIEI